MNSKWDARFLELAEFVGKWSKDKAKVGAVLATPRSGAIALGYNGFPVGVEDRVERLEDSDIKLDMVVHAEQNALLIAGPAALGAHLYVHGKPVCSRCAGMIIQAGVKRVIAMDPEKIDAKSKWRPKGILALEMFREAGVQVDIF